MNSRSKTVGVILGVVFLIAMGVTSVQADSVSAHRWLDDLNHGEQVRMVLFEVAQEEAVAYLQNQHTNQGKHLGFNVASMHQGPTLAVVGYYGGHTAATPNPEPTTIMLLGTGILAVGALARRRLHR